MPAALRLLVIGIIVLAPAPRLGAANLGGDPDSTADEAATIFPHPDDSRFWISGQSNFIFQWHPAFHAPYTGTNSVSPHDDNAESSVVTLYTGLQLTATTEAIFDVESAGGSGLSGAVGLGGFSNLDVVRNPALTAAPYVARAFVRQILALSDEAVSATRGPLSLFTRLPARRLEVRIGKLGLVDFFDTNAVGSDSHMQFMNWTVDNNGAFDFAADTRGYTYAAMLEYADRAWSARFAEALMPKIANGPNLDWNVEQAHAENLEFEYRTALLPQRSGAVRLLSYVNHAHMGSYHEAIGAFLTGRDTVPNIEAHRHQGRLKYGFGINAEQELTAALRAFVRAGWNDGRHESFAFTEVDTSGAAGADVAGAVWHRDDDKLGIALSINALSDVHRRYLALGGHGFLLGDGRLNYNTEQIGELYYTVHLWRGLSTAVDVQYIRHPGYNRDRGPIVIPGGRVHIEF